MQDNQHIFFSLKDYVGLLKKRQQPDEILCA